MQQSSFKKHLLYYLLQPGEVEYNAVFQRLKESPSLQGYYFGHITTGIACRYDCSVKVPKPGEVIIAKRIYDLICLGYQECPHCHPLSHQSIEAVHKYLSKVEEETFPDRNAAALQKEAKSWFQLAHHADLEKYVQVKRVHSILANALSNRQGDNALQYQVYWTPLGAMVACFSPRGLCLLDFTDRKGVEAKLIQLVDEYKAYFVNEASASSEELREQLNEYFTGQRTEFTVPLDQHGSAFQKSAWEALKLIPFGETRSYLQQAQSINKPQSVRAIANANGRNFLSLLIPCHRVIGADGKLTGYGGGLDRKGYLIAMEKAVARRNFGDCKKEVVTAMAGDLSRQR